jgi:sucrose-6-phosphatase
MLDRQLLKLFVTDLDYTLIGDDSALAEILQVLTQYRQLSGTKIVYATGRSLTSYQELAAQKSLISPDALVVAVGTEIYNLDRSPDPDPEWSEQLAINWHRAQIVEICDRFSALTPQPATEQRPFKISYFLAPELATAVLSELKDCCAAQQLEVEIVYSGALDLDLLPKGRNKGGAIAFLQHKWAIDSCHSVVCGDSGNDISLFDRFQAKGIMVGNARSELLDWYRQNQSDLHYLAQAHYSAGILEGLKHFKFYSDSLQ